MIRSKRVAASSETAVISWNRCTTRCFARSTVWHLESCCRVRTHQLSKVGVFRYCRSSSETSRELQRNRNQNVYDPRQFSGCALTGSPHLQDLVPDVFTLLPGFVQGSLVVERRRFVGSVGKVFEEPQPAEMFHALKAIWIFKNKQLELFRTKRNQRNPIRDTRWEDEQIKAITL